MTEGPLEPLTRLVGTWVTEAFHPEMPDVTVYGTATIEWLEGERFLVLRARSDHADFPDSISMIGSTEMDRVEDSPSADPLAETEADLSMHYFDSRGVFRVYSASMDEGVWRLWRDAPGFAQRFTGTFAGDGHTIEGQWQMGRDDRGWDDDVQITYRREH